LTDRGVLEPFQADLSWAGVEALAARSALWFRFLKILISYSCGRTKWFSFAPYLDSVIADWVEFEESGANSRAFGIRGLLRLVVVRD